MGGTEFSRDEVVDSFGHKILGGIAEFIARAIQSEIGLETRSMVLSHLQRGGVPCAYDRRMGRYFGIAAVDLVVMEYFGKMVSYRNGKIVAVPIEDVQGATRPSPVTSGRGSSRAREPASYASAPDLSRFLWR